MPRLRRSDASMPGFARRRRGSGFQYLDPDGRPVGDPETLERIRDLAIPPAWRDVWICPFDNGHLQAVGIDAAGRTQYLYHRRWRERRDQAKFEHMVEFGRALPGIRATTAENLALQGFPRERVLACAVRLLDIGFFRIGSEDYTELHGTYGLATMLKRHVDIDGDMVTFDYPAKGGKRRIQSVVDPTVVKVIAGLKRRRGGGPELLAFKRGNRWRDLRSDDINDYIKDVAADEFTAKDFRTWSATVLAAAALALSADGTSKTGRQRIMSAAVKDVAWHLGNTPTVCRNSYIDPRVFDRYRAGVTIRDALGKVTSIRGIDLHVIQRTVESAVLDLLEEDAKDPATA